MKTSNKHFFIILFAILVATNAFGSSNKNVAESFNKIDIDYSRKVERDTTKKLTFEINSISNESYAFKSYVNGKGQDIILIPGLASSYQVWDKTVEKLSKKYRTHAIQLPGFAGAKPMEFDSSFVPKMGEELIRYIKTEKLKSPIIIGHSLGGFLSLYIASKEPNLISKVISVDGIPFLGGLQNPNITPVQAKTMAEMMVNQTKSQPKESRDMMQAQMIKSMVTDSLDQIRVIEWGKKSDMKTVNQAMYDLYTIDIRKDISKIKVPVLVLGAWVAYKNYGVTRDMVKANYANQMKELPSAKIELTDIGKHFIMYDDPEFFFNQLESFLN